MPAPIRLSPDRAADPWCRWLTARMQALGLSPTLLARQLVCTRSTIHRYLTPRATVASYPTAARIEALAILLGVPAAEIRKTIAAARVARGELSIPADCVRDSDTHLPNIATSETREAV